MAGDTDVGTYDEDDGDEPETDDEVEDVSGVSADATLTRSRVSRSASRRRPGACGGPERGRHAHSHGPILHTVRWVRCVHGARGKVTKFDTHNKVL